MTRRLILCYDLAVVPYALKGAKAGPCVIVLNPNDGIGTPDDPDWSAWQEVARRLGEFRGSVVLGYMDLVAWKGAKFTVKSPALLAAEAKKWGKWEGISGVWLDDAFDARNDIRQRITTIKYSHPHLKLALNPGTSASAWAWNIADLVCDHEANRPRDPIGWSTTPIVAKEKTVRICKGTAKTAATIAEQATAANIAAVCITDRMNYQTPPSWEA